MTSLREKDGVFRFPLKRKNYDELIGEHYIPRILIVVLIPTARAKWIEQTKEALCLRKCGYWVSLRDLPPRNNAATVTVNIGRSSVFSPMALRNLLPEEEST